MSEYTFCILTIPGKEPIDTRFVYHVYRNTKFIAESQCKYKDVLFAVVAAISVISVISVIISKKGKMECKQPDYDFEKYYSDCLNIKDKILNDFQRIFKEQSLKKFLQNLLGEYLKESLGDFRHESLGDFLKESVEESLEKSLEKYEERTREENLDDYLQEYLAEYLEETLEKYLQKSLGCSVIIP